MTGAWVGQDAGWSRTQRVLFRFAVLYVGWYSLAGGGAQLVLWMLPYVSRPIYWLLGTPQNAAAMWAGTHVFHLSGEETAWHRTGSGDTALAWLNSLSLLVVSLAGAAVWSVISEVRGGRREYRTLYAWLLLLVRFTLASTLLSYGFSKVFDLQFSPPPPERLAETFGSASPMGLLWTFMGASVPYTVFSGLAEVAPGLLLLFRRTSTVGALASSAVMLNVVLLNFCYDVPVKLYSSHLLLLSLFLLLPDMAPMWRFFIGRSAAALQGMWLPRAERRALRIAAICFQVLTIGHLLYVSAAGNWEIWRAAQSPLMGNWAIDSAEGSIARMEWKTVAISNPYFLRYTTPRESGWLSVNVLARQQVVEILSPPKPDGSQGPPDGELHWSGTSSGTISGRLTLAGQWHGQTTSVTMHQVAAEKSPLESRGFHWVQEYPYNR